MVRLKIELSQDTFPDAVKAQSRDRGVSPPIPPRLRACLAPRRLLRVALRAPLC